MFYIPFQLTVVLGLCCEIFQDQIDAYKAKKKAIDAAPIKKIAEAKARKKRRVCILPLAQLFAFLL